METSPQLAPKSTNTLELCNELDCIELDNSELESTELDCAELESNELERTELDCSELDCAELERTELERSELDAGGAGCATHLTANP